VAPLADAHEIVVMEGGRVVARGSHEELMEHSSFYATIYRQQTDSMPLIGSGNRGSLSFEAPRGRGSRAG